MMDILAHSSLVFVERETREVHEIKHLARNLENLILKQSWVEIGIIIGQNFIILKKILVTFMH